MPHTKKERGRRWKICDFEYEEQSQCLRGKGQELYLKSNEANLLVLLIDNVHDNDELIDAIWGSQKGKEASLYKSIELLRTAFGGPRQSIIANRPFRIVGPVDLVSPDASVKKLEFEPQSKHPSELYAQRGATDSTAHSPSQQTDVQSLVSGHAHRSINARPPALVDPLKADIGAYLQRHPQLGLAVVDEFLELHHSPNWRGWHAREVVFEEVGEYEPPPDFRPFLQRFKPKFNKGYYSLCGFGPLPTADDEQDLAVYALGGSFHHVHALTRIFEEQDLAKDCRVFRRWCEESFLPIPRSPLYHNINCQVIVVTDDNCLVLGRRRMNTPFFAGAWTLSLEEQMLRNDPSPDATITKDLGLFECAERGATGELGITVNPNKPTLLLSVGIEWRNFTAAFVFVIHANEDFGTIKNKRWPQAADRNEAIALDCIPASLDSLREALASPLWVPTAAAKADPVVGQDALHEAMWHPTARARIEAYLQHRTTPR